MTFIKTEFRCQFIQKAKIGLVHIILEGGTD